MSEKTKIYPEGIRTFKPHEKAPDFVKGSLIITLNELIDYCKKHPELLTEYQGKKQLKCKMLDGRYGISIEVDTYGLDVKDDKFEDVEDLPFD